MRNRLILAAALAACSLAPSIAGTLPPETPLVVDGPIKIDAADLEGYMLRVPEQHRAEVRASFDRIATMVDNMFVARSLATKARAAGLDKDPTVQRRLAQVQEALLADLYLAHLDKTAPKLDLEARVRELYLADQSKFVIPEQVHIEHILIGLQGRTREMAEERAKKVYEDAKSGKEEFLALAARMSDDPEKKKNGGDLGYNSPTSFYPAINKRLATMKKGEISEPLESHSGFHIVRLVDRKAPEQRKFEEVRKSLITAELERLSKKRHEDALQEIRGSRTVTLHLDNIRAMVTPLGDVLPKAAAADAAAPKAGDRSTR